MPTRKREGISWQLPAFIGSVFLVVAMATLSVRWAGAATNPTVTVSLDKSVLSAGSTATVTFTFSAQPLGFGNDDVDLSDAHGTLSPVTADALDPKIYTATFTPDAGVIAPSSTIGVGVHWTDTSFHPPDVASVSASTFYSNAALGTKAVAFDGTNVWTANRDDDSVTRVTPGGAMTTFKVTGHKPSAIAFDGTNMWTADRGSDTVTKIAPDGTGTQTALAAGAQPSGIAYGGNAIWVANEGDGSVTRIGIGSGTLTTYAGVGPGPSAVAFDGLNAWVTLRGSNSVIKIDPVGTITSYAGTGNIPSAIAFDGTDMWTANVGDNSVTKISPTGVMTSYNGIGAGPTAIAFDGFSMWTANFSADSLSKVSAAGIVTTYPGAGAQPAGIVSAGSRLWVADSGDPGNGVTKFGVEHAAVSPTYSVNTLGGSGCQAPTVKLVAPNGGESLVPGTEVDVFWSSSGCQVTGLTLRLSEDSGATWPTTIMTTALPTSGYYRWTVPQMDTTGARLRADLLGQGDVLLASDVSDGTFTVQPPAGTTVVPTQPAPAPAQAPVPEPPPVPTLAPSGTVTAATPVTPSPRTAVKPVSTAQASADATLRTQPPALPPPPPDAVPPSPAAPPQTPTPMPVSLDQVQQAVDAVATAAPASWSSAISFAEGALAMLGVLFGAQQILKRRGGGSNMGNCSHCHGTGKEPKKNVALGSCEDCEGTGMTEDENEQTVECKHCEGEGQDPCHFCKGEGKDEKGGVCAHCGGEGVTPSGKKDKNGKSKPKRCCKCLGKGEVDVNIKTKSACKTCGGTGKG